MKLRDTIYAGVLEGAIVEIRTDTVGFICNGRYYTSLKKHVELAGGVDNLVPILGDIVTVGNSIGRVVRFTPTDVWIVDALGRQRACWIYNAQRINPWKEAPVSGEIVTCDGKVGVMVSRDRCVVEGVAVKVEPKETDVYGKMNIPCIGDIMESNGKLHKILDYGDKNIMTQMGTYSLNTSFKRVDTSQIIQKYKELTELM